MAKDKIITALDIGSGKIKMLIAQKGEDDNFKVLFQGEEPSLGVRKGVVVDIETVTRTINLLLERSRRESSQKVNSVFVNINGSHLISASSQGMIAVSRADRCVSKEDVERVLQEASRALSLPSNNEILETFLKEFIIDGVGEIKLAEGLEGGRLETEILVLTCFSPYKNNLIQAVSETDLGFVIVPGVLADAEVVLSQKQKELGVAVLNIGAATSELAVFEEGDLIHTAVFPIGSAHITSDIAVGLKVDIDIAEIIKTKIGSCSTKGDKKEKIEIEGEGELVFSQKMLTKIIVARVSQIFAEVRKELKKIGKENLLPAGIVLTGGGAKLPKMVDLAKKDLKLLCRLGKINYFPDLADDLSLTTLCGLVVKGWQGVEEKDYSSGKGFFKKVFSKIKNIFKSFAV